MGKKKRGHPDIEEILARPWCYYCERDFDDLKILINHQKAKHFKCERCGRRLNTAGGLSVHMTQVHKETLTVIENALPNRSNLDVEIFGMEGIPEEAASNHKQRVAAQFAQAEAEHRATTGNPASGAAQGNATKKPKFESPADIKKRLAEHKAKVAAEEAAAAANPGMNNAEVPPMEAQAQGFGPAPGINNPYLQQYAGPPAAAPYGSFPQLYGQPAHNFQPHGQGFPVGAVPPFGQQSFSPPQQYPPTSGAYGPPPQFQAGPNHPPFNTGSPAPPPFPSVSPPAPYRNRTPPQGMSQPQRPNSLPSAPGLPQRPSFGAPPVNAFQLQQMHQGQTGGPQPMPYGDQMQHGAMNGAQGPPPGLAGSNGMPAPAKSPLNNLAAAIAASGNSASATPIPQDARAGVISDAGASDKKLKKNKDKDKEVKMVYSDNDVSPEEKMASLPRYAFAPTRKEETVLGDARNAAVAGVVEQGAEDMPMDG